MRSTLKPLLSLASHLQVITRGGGGDLSVIFFRDLSLINHPCYLGYKGEVGYMRACTTKCPEVPDNETPVAVAALCHDIRRNCFLMSSLVQKFN